MKKETNKPYVCAGCWYGGNFFNTVHQGEIQGGYMCLIDVRKQR